MVKSVIKKRNLTLMLVLVQKLHKTKFLKIPKCSFKVQLMVSMFVYSLMVKLVVVRLLLFKEVRIIQVSFLELCKSFSQLRREWRKTTTIK
jgi:type III secretory pathway component EscU